MSSEGIGFFLSVLRKYASLGAAGFLQLNPDDFFFLWHHFFLIILPSSILVRALSNLTVHTSVLPAKTLPLPCLFHNHAYGMLSDGLDSSSFAMVTLVRCFFLNSSHSLDVNSITFLADLHVHGQRTNSVSQKA